MISRFELNCKALAIVQDFEMGIFKKKSKPLGDSLTEADRRNVQLNYVEKYTTWSRMFDPTASNSVERQKAWKVYTLARDVRLFVFFGIEPDPQFYPDRDHFLNEVQAAIRGESFPM